VNERQSASSQRHCMKQGKLFQNLSRLPPGMLYVPDFITEKEEAELLSIIASLPLQEAKYKAFTAKRRIISYGGTYDFSTNELTPAEPIPDFLYPLRSRVAQWAEVPESHFTHALIAEYRTGTQLGWHRDVPEFEIISGVSLGGQCRMRLRPYPAPQDKRTAAFSIDLAPRSAYIMRDEARWRWQHSIPPTKTLRYSITFRTRLTRFVPACQDSAFPE
jgi:alkylated DNA repair dioxygenase AlkB